jgi:hypothetical protein
MNSQDDKTPQDDAFLQRASGLFEDSVEGLDARTRSRLNQGRQQALAALESRSALWSRWLPAGVAAAVAMVALVMWNGGEQPGAFDAPDFAVSTMASDFEILLDEDELEMLEDLEFYSWIELDESELDNDLDEHVG